MQENEGNAERNEKADYWTKGSADRIPHKQFKTESMKMNEFTMSGWGENNTKYGANFSAAWRQRMNYCKIGFVNIRYSMINGWVKIPLVIRQDAKNRTKKLHKQKVFSRTLDPKDEGETKAKYKTTLANMASRQTQKGDWRILIPAGMMK